MSRKKKETKTEVAKASIDISKGIQINGALEGISPMLDTLRKREFPYSVDTLPEYRKNLDKMNLSDLQRHAIEVAHILPNITERSRLVDKLEREFLRRQSIFVTRYSPVNSTVSSMTSEQEAEIKGILKKRGL
jgi:hypothetical protein